MTRFLPRRAATMLLLAVVVPLGTLAGCGGGSSSPEAVVPTSTTVKPGTATITSFDVPASVQCTGGPSITFSVTYATQGAAYQQLIVDGRAGDRLTAASGTIEAPVHCDALKHTVVLAAYDKADGLTSQAKYLDTVVSAS